MTDDEADVVIGVITITNSLDDVHVDFGDLNVIEALGMLDLARLEIIATVYGLTVADDE